MWTIPNILTVQRLLAAPCVALVFVVVPRGPADALAFALFTAAAVTDFLDGWLARRLGQTSALGTMLDPIADKAMVTIALATLMGLYGLAWWLVLPASIILLREVLISGLREFLGDVKLTVTRLAKWKTAAQLVAIGALLLAGAAGSDVLVGAGGVLLWLSAGLTAITGWDYFRKALPYIRAREETR